VCVDDDPMITSLLSFQLRKIINNKNTFIETYSQPTEVEDKIEELIRFGVSIIFIIVDYQMPEMTGAQLIRKVKEKYPDVSCIMLSGQANELIVSELQKENLLETFLSKPWSEKALFDVVQPLIVDTLA
jgi:FixJ family two-component response regulator